MTTNRVRRDIAARLRFYDHNMSWEKGCESIAHDVRAGITGNAHSDVLTFAHRLADLIEPEPERTCRIKQHRCTNCDHEINDRAYFVKVELDGGAWTADSRTANFCPNCGAKVVES